MIHKELLYNMEKKSVSTVDFKLHPRVICSKNVDI